MNLMSIQAIEDLLEATRQKIASQGSIVDAHLLDKERMLEQAVIDSYLDAPIDPRNYRVNPPTEDK